MNVPAVGPCKKIYHSLLLSNINTLTLHHTPARYLMRLSKLKSNILPQRVKERPRRRAEMRLFVESNSTASRSSLRGGY